MLLKKETWHDAAYNQAVINWDYPNKFFQMRLELRGSNTQRSTIHIWIDRALSLWYDLDEAPDGFDVYTYLENDFHRRYYNPACAGKIQRIVQPATTPKKKKKKKKSKKNKKLKHQRRKVQVLPFEAPLILLDIYKHMGWNLFIIQIVRATASKYGALWMPMYIIRKLTQNVSMSNCAHRDLAYINYQRQIAMIYSIVINIRSGKINFITGEIDDEMEWTLKPAVLDAHTYRNGMRDDNNKFSIFNIVLCTSFV